MHGEIVRWPREFNQLWKICFLFKSVIVNFTVANLENIILLFIFFLSVMCGGKKVEM